MPSGLQRTHRTLQIRTGVMSQEHNFRWRWMSSRRTLKRTDETHTSSFFQTCVCVKSESCGGSTRWNAARLFLAINRVQCYRDAAQEGGKMYALLIPQRSACPCDRQTLDICVYVCMHACIYRVGGEGCSNTCKLAIEKSNEA